MGLTYSRVRVYLNPQATLHGLNTLYLWRLNPKPQTLNPKTYTPWGHDLGLLKPKGMGPCCVRAAVQLDLGRRLDCRDGGQGRRV